MREVEGGGGEVREARNRSGRWREEWSREGWSGEGEGGAGRCTEAHGRAACNTDARPREGSCRPQTHIVGRRVTGEGRSPTDME